MTILPLYWIISSQIYLINIVNTISTNITYGIYIDINNGETKKNAFLFKFNTCKTPC